MKLNMKLVFVPNPPNRHWRLKTMNHHRRTYHVSESLSVNGVYGVYGERYHIIMIISMHHCTIFSNHDVNCVLFLKAIDAHPLENCLHVDGFTKRDLYLHYNRFDWIWKLLSMKNWKRIFFFSIFLFCSYKCWIMASKGHPFVLHIQITIGIQVNLQSLLSGCQHMPIHSIYQLLIGETN